MLEYMGFKVNEDEFETEEEFQKRVKQDSLKLELRIDENQEK